MGHLSPCEEAAGRCARGGAEPGGSGYLPSGCRCELKAPQHHTQQGQELFVLVVKAVPEDNRTDDVGDSSAQEEGGIDEGAWGGAGRGGTAICESVGGQPQSAAPGPRAGSPTPTHKTVPSGARTRVRPCCIPPGAAQCGVPGSPRVPRRASTRKPASSWMRSSMPRLPTPKSRSVVMEKRRSCLARSPLLKATPAEGE